MKVNNFDVLKRMSELNGKCYLTPLDNILNMRKTKKGTQVTMGVGLDCIHGLLAGQYVGGLILADKEEFERVKAELEGV